ncbi:hypothetical protein B0T36_03385 [Nocardia donostiensis]|uniref:hypothetical protein n=1 Tax=Nocardia donostiensis TaxID=1538463 RepID=UPI0009D9743B|nr:hypothetical protein [Nocardia donostiensis]OQS16725.1 hypothetical protein B0T36_03385 [Nocardia donostiensis]
MTGTDPNYINAMEHFESMRHEDIYAKAQQIDAVEILRVSGAWLEVAAGLSSSFPLTRDSADRVMNAMEWEGAAADAAYASTRSFADSIDELAAVLGQVGGRLAGVAAAAEAVKLAVVPPGNSGPVGTIARILEAANVIDAQQAQETLRQEAVLTMNMVYKPAYSTAGTDVPALPAPPPPPGTPPPLSAPPAPLHATPPLPPESSGTQAPSSNPNGSAPSYEPETPASPSAPRSESEQPQAPGEPEQTPPPVPPPAQTPPPPPPPAAEPPVQAPPPAEAPFQIPEPAEPPVQIPPPRQTPFQPPSVPDPPAPLAIPAPADPPAPPPIPAPADPPAPPPIPEPGLPPIPLVDPSGQPGITGPIPGEDGPAAPDQPGVIPPDR